MDADHSRTLRDNFQIEVSAECLVQSAETLLSLIHNLKRSYLVFSGTQQIAVDAEMDVVLDAVAEGDTAKDEAAEELFE